jgi:hypothetical protein
MNRRVGSSGQEAAEQCGERLRSPAYRRDRCGSWQEERRGRRRVVGERMMSSGGDPRINEDNEGGRSA